MLIAKVRLTKSENDDLKFEGFIHPQIDSEKLIRAIASNVQLDGPEYEVVVTSTDTKNEYKIDVNPVGEEAN